jgi:hypothetical protein
MFKKGGFLTRLQTGQLKRENTKNNHLTREKALKQRQAYCTHSQTIEYLEGQIRIALVHQYLAPDGVSLGGSGEPDPKYLEFNGTIYAEWIRDTWYRKAWYWGIGWIAEIRYKLMG